MNRGILVTTPIRRLHTAPEHPGRRPEERFLTEKNVYFDTAPHGFISFGEFMQSAGLIQEVPGSWRDLIYPNLENAAGS